MVKTYILHDPTRFVSSEVRQTTPPKTTPSLPSQGSASIEVLRELLPEPLSELVRLDLDRLGTARLVLLASGEGKTGSPWSVGSPARPNSLGFWAKAGQFRSLQKSSRNSWNTRASQNQNQNQSSFKTSFSPKPNGNTRASLTRS